MARRYRRRKLFRTKLKGQTILSVFAFLLWALALLTFLSFFQKGSMLGVINTFVRNTFGVGAYFFPVILVFVSFLFVRIKTPFTRSSVSLGLLLSYICLLALTQSGFVGEQIWYNFALSVSELGAFFVLLLMFLVGLIVFFNISLEDLAKVTKTISESLAKAFALFSSQTKKTVFIEKLPMRAPTDYKQQSIALDKENKTPQAQKRGKPMESPPSLIGTNVISNFAPNNEIWEFPSLSLLSVSSGQKADRGDLKQSAATIEKTLESFGINAQVVEVNLGPAVTQYSLNIALGTKVSKITALSNDLALALAAPTGQIRIEAPIPGRSLVGIEIPNRTLEFVTLRHMIGSDIMKKSKDKLLVALGLDVSGNPIISNIAKMPHVLIAGTTGSGKSVLINSWIASLLFRTTPQEVRLIMVDPKRVELIGYNGIPHLLTPVIVEPDKILSALKWAMQEMDRRYRLFSEVGVRNIDGYNELSGFQAIPYIVIFIDELADLMAYAPVEVEDAICRIAQLARATGIHLVVATQRPSVDVITGLIKANIPSRISFNVSSMIDSRVIIDMPGAERLLGRGDMLYIPPDQAKPTRIQGTYVSEQDVKNLVEFLKTKNKPVEYTQEVTSIAPTWKKSSAGAPVSDDGKDQLFDDAVRVVCQYDRASASLLQRRLSIGYARAARILDQLEEEGIVAAAEGAKPRDVLVRNADEYFENRETTSKTQ